MGFRLVLGDRPQAGDLSLDNQAQVGWNWQDMVEIEIDEGYLFYTFDPDAESVTTHALSDDLTRLVTTFSETGPTASDMGGFMFVSYCYPL